MGPDASNLWCMAAMLCTKFGAPQQLLAQSRCDGWGAVYDLCSGGLLEPGEPCLLDAGKLLP